jgi:hypothetical protein
MKWLACVLAMSALSTGVDAQDSSQGSAKPVDLTSISIEDLMNIQVTSASKKAESLSSAPAAIFVITGEDIRRGGFLLGSGCIAHRAGVVRSATKRTCLAGFGAWL